MAVPSLLLILDMINDLVHDEGAFGGHPLIEQVRSRRVVENTSIAIANARAASVPIGFVRLGFSSDYREAPEYSPVFSAARDRGMFQMQTWGGQVHDALKPRPNEFEIIKHRVSPFYGTPLETMLHVLGVKRLFLAGVTTNGVVHSAVRDAHDRDYLCVLLEDCCAAHTQQIHDASVLLASRCAEISASTANCFAD